MDLTFDKSLCNRLWFEHFETNGCCLLPETLNREQLDHYCQEIERVLSQSDAGILRSQGIAYGVRNLLQLWPRLVELAKLEPVRTYAAKILGGEFGIVRALLFDKPPERTWNLPWHRDRTIAIAESCIGNPLPAGLSNLTIKAGVPHAIAPEWLLKRMVTLRYSLDPMTPENGPLVFLVGSHNCEPHSLNLDAASSGNLDNDLAQIHTNSIGQLTCNAGDVFVMRPLLAHSSLASCSHTKLRRRVIHIELCARTDEIPWYEYHAI